MMISNRNSRLRFSLVMAAGAMALLCMTAASAATELTEIEWNASNAFERAMDVAPGKFAELCGKLTKGQSIAWSFKAPQPLDFNIHFHEGKNVVFPARKEQVAALVGELKVALDQDYCWMWENKTGAKTSVTVELHRR